MIKLLFLLPDVKSGGAQTAVLRILKHLKRRKFKIHLVLCQLYGELISNIPEDVTIHHLNCRRRRYAFFPVLKVIKKVRPDIIFSTLYSLNIIVLSTKVLGAHRFPIIIRESTMLSERIGNSFVRFIISKFYPVANRIICMTGAMAEDLERHFGIDAKIISIIGLFFIVYPPLKYHLKLSGSLNGIYF